MGEGMTLLDAVYNGGRLLSLASLVYFLYLMFRVCMVLNFFSADTLRHFAQPAENREGGSGRGS